MDSTITQKFPDQLTETLKRANRDRAYEDCKKGETYPMFVDGGDDDQQQRRAVRRIR